MSHRTSTQPSGSMLAGLFLLALAVRLGAGALLMALGLWNGDEQYRVIAQHIVEGDGFHAATIDVLEGLDPERTGVIERMRSPRAPGYSVLLAILMTWFGSGDIPVLVTQALASAAVPVLVVLVGLRLFERRVALLAGLATALYPYSVLQDVRLFDTPYFEVLLGVSLLSLMRLAERGETRAAVVAGAALGLGIAMRSFFAAFPVFAAIGLLLTTRVPRRRMALLIGTMLATTAIALSPWIVRNYRVHGVFLATSTYGGWNFYLGNNERTVPLLRAGRELDGPVAEALNREPADLRGLSEIELDRSFYARGLSYVSADPGGAVGRTAYKLLNLWSPILNPPADDPLRNLVHMAAYGPVLVLAIIGMVLTFGQARRYWAIYALFIYFSLLYSGFITLSRYRKPLDPYLMLFAATAFWWLVDRVSRPATATPTAAGSDR